MWWESGVAWVTQWVQGTGVTDAQDHFREAAIRRLVDLLGELSDQFTEEYAQHDPHDVWMTLVNHLPLNVLQRFTYTSVIQQRCPECDGEGTARRNPMTCISLRLVARTLEGCLEGYLQPLELDDAHGCETCGSNRVQHISHEGRPQFLLVQLMRSLQAVWLKECRVELEQPVFFVVQVVKTVLHAIVFCLAS